MPQYKRNDSLGNDLNEIIISIWRFIFWLFVIDILSCNVNDDCYIIVSMYVLWLSCYLYWTFMYFVLDNIMWSYGKKRKTSTNKTKRNESQIQQIFLFLFVNQHMVWRRIPDRKVQALAWHVGDAKFESPRGQQIVQPLSLRRDYKPRSQHS